MPHYALLLAPSANRVYAGEAATLAAAELEICRPDITYLAATEIAGVRYLTFDAPEPVEVGDLSATFALFRREGELLRPVSAGPLIDPAIAAVGLGDDLVTIPKYQGKTNEQFTRLLLNVTLAVADRPREGRIVLDPLCGRGTTLSLAWLLGLDAAGVEAQEKAVEAHAAFLKTYLRRKRIKHTADLTAVRREGKVLGQRLEVTLTEAGRRLTMITGDTRQSAALFGKRKFDVVVADAPYGVVHGARTDVHGVSGKRDRSPAGLLSEAIPVWASQLKKGGALGLSWNTYGLAREDLHELMAEAGLVPQTGGPWERFAHRVDASINRDLAVAVMPKE